MCDAILFADCGLWGGFVNFYPDSLHFDAVHLKQKQKEVNILLKL